MAKQVTARIGQIEDGRWCMVISEDKPGHVTVLSVWADEDKSAVERRIKTEMKTRPWETRQ